MLVIYDVELYSRTTPTELGERVRFELFWNARFARMWAGVQPEWSLIAQLAATAAPTVTHLGATPEQNTQM
ncbi:hypothetical protein [Rhodococcus sp. AW25M09]|uniref:hypothetical protein n=1 Tax=Rhodococcus sp. AW25M09 TaxID=1268303 RepID=UPI0012FA3F3F|nr:hypothetical protein [Rhodococcus sp. AW25M09]